MTIRTIYIQPKTTSANTQYYNMDKADKTYIFETMAKVLPEWIEKGCDNPDIFEALYTPETNLSKYEDPQTNKMTHNSVVRFVAGVLKNYYSHNGTNDVSKPQLDSLTRIFDLINNWDCKYTSIVFVEGAKPHTQKTVLDDLLVKE